MAGSEMGGLVNKMDDDVHENVVLEERTKDLRAQHKDIARRNASKYAFFDAREEENDVNDEDDDDDEEIQAEEPVGNVEDWPGPFSTAMKIIRDREKNSSRQARDSSSVKEGFPLVSWTPRKERDLECRKREAPSLISLCLNVLAENVDAITSLDTVPDALRNKLSRLLCDSRKMNPHFLGLLLDGSPSEIRLSDCSWLEERVFEKLFEACDTKIMTVLQLDLCGHCVSDSLLRKALIPKGLEALTTISLKGGCRISDAGLAALVSSAPALRSMNLSQCTLLTDVGIDSIANSLGLILQELYLDDCETLDAMRILPKLQQLKALEVLSLRGIVSVSDKFIKKLFGENGQNTKELVLANCVNLTDSSLKVIANTCSQLRVLDLSYLGKLSDVGMAYITNGCRSIQDLKLCRSPFSDDAIAAFLETSGESLIDLSLNNISKVGQNTTISLARRCKNLESLDLSWCRLLTNEALGLIADSCLSLRLLKLFGCTQVTEVFVDGHSNQHLHIVGLKLTPILEHIKRPDFQQGPLHYSTFTPY
uniref:F-box/LRR-repeat protein 15-like leucin rich repeat domain-containing protein n=2 Tax=Chenopodium quinoa TaxID=63459 RepID=A0A803M8M0_CHEQI